MQLYLIRHAQSKNNANPLHLREEDPPLTAVGRLQASHLADWLKTLKFDVLITSPVRRALQTTRFVRDLTNHHVHVWDDVFEEGGIFRGHGPDAVEGGPGLSRNAVIEHVDEEAGPITLDESIDDAGWWGCRERESPDAAQERANGVHQRLINQFAEQETVILISHADFKRRLLVQMLAPESNPVSFGRLRNTGVTKVDWDGSRWQLDWFNSVTHLPARLITGNE